jgi:hypothetical protein
MNIQQIAKEIKIPLNKWPGNCYAIAVAMVKAELVKGKAVYGHYHGKIHPNSIFGGRPFTHHGWIECETHLVDPTRWAFECVPPYIYTGSKDDEDYDKGSNRLRKMLMRPAPNFNPKQNKFTLPSHLQPFATTMLGDDRIEICFVQLMWLASLPLDMLEDMAEPLFRWIVDEIKLPGVIPFDNRIEVMKC